MTVADVPAEAADAGEPAAKRSRSHAGGYQLAVLPSPVADDLAQRIHGCMCEVYQGDFAKNGFGEDQLARLRAPGCLYALATLGEDVVATAMTTVDGDVGLVGGVCTRPAHQRRGLSRALMTMLLEATRGPRWLILGTGSRGAAKVYGELGFRGLAGSLDGGKKGYNPDDEGEWIMLRDSERPAASAAPPPAGNEPFDSEAYALAGPVTVEALSRRHWAAAVLLLNAVEGRDKLRAFGIDEGCEAERRLAQAFRDGDRVTVAVHEASRRILGLAYHDSTAGLEVYSIGPSSTAAALVAGVPSVVPGSLKSEWMTFWERGYLVFPGLLAGRAAAIRRECAMLAAGASKATADWNAVNSGGAEFVLQVDEQGQPVPGRILKVQAAALAAKVVLDVFSSPEVREKVKCLFSMLGQEVPEHVDVFGTKFFPMWPGGTSVSWHQDCHYFGTASPRLISCGVYLEDTDRENGCLRVVPGSHTRGVYPHAPGVGRWAQGEWVEVDDARGVDVAVPAGSVVLFSAMLLHAAHRNSHTSRTRYSMFGHFVPSSLNFAWRGTDFSHGIYPDRHEVY